MPPTRPMRAQTSTKKPCMNAINVERTRTARIVQSSGVSVCMARWYLNLSPSSAEIELAAGEEEVSIQVLTLRFCHDVVGQRGRGRLLVPLNLLEIVADELLVEGGLRSAGLVLVGRPVAGGVGGEDLVGEDDAPRSDAELKLGVGQDDATLGRVGSGAVVDVEAEALELGGGGLADARDHFVEGDVLVVLAAEALPRWREERLGQPGGFLPGPRQRDAADSS